MKKSSAAAAAAGLLAFAGLTHAQGYVGVSGGATHLEADCTGTTSCDNNGTGFKLFGGYKFTPNLAGELVYLNFGKAKASANIGGTLISAEIKTSAVGGGVAVMGDLAPNVPASARLGVASVKADLSGRAGAVSVSDSDSSTQAYFGLDVGYAFSKALAVTLSADFSRSKSSGDTGSVRMIGLGITFSF